MININNYFLHFLTNLIGNPNLFQDKNIINKSNENEKNILFLNKKRNPETFLERNHLFMKGNEALFLNQNAKLMENELKIKEEEIKKNYNLISKNYLLLNNNLYNSANNNNFELFSNSNNISQNIYNKIISKEEKNFNIYSSNIIKIDNNFENISSNNTIHLTNSQNKDNVEINKKKIFIVKKDNYNNLINTNESNNNNEVKVFKNKKVVYINSYLLNSYSSKNLKKVKNVAFIGTTKRSSRFRGVSKNGNQWQVVMMYNKNKSYAGCYTSEENAARIYDILAIKKRGIRAKTNFVYTISQMEKISEMKIDIKDKNINEIIENYFLSF